MEWMGKEWSMARTPKVVEDRREQIIDAAMRVFAEKGFGKATNKDIAREAGITPGLIYYYFESKEALLKAIIETRSPVQMITSLPPQIFELPPQVFLRMVVLRVLSIVEGENFIRLIRMLLPEIIHDPGMTSIATPFMQRAFEFLGGYFEAQVEKGALRRMDGSLIAQIMIGSVVGFVLRRQVLQDRVALQYSHEQLADAICETVLQGVLPR
jgi:AcrR family transcriptional regulator